MQPISKAVLFALLISLFGFNAYAQKDEMVIAQAPGSFSLHGVVYHKLLRDAVPPATSYVTDWEDIFTEAQEAQLDSMIANFENKTTIQVAVVTIDSCMTTSDEFDSTTLKIANTWGVGQKDKNNGVVIGISRSLRMMRIQNGAGISPQLNDTDTQQIVDSVFLPYFEKGQFFEGTQAGLNAIMVKLKPASN
jgi:uncharacterized protein